MDRKSSKIREGYNRYVFPYLILFLIPILLICAFLFKYYHDEKIALKMSAYNTMVKEADHIETRFDEIDNIIQQISFGDSISDIFKNDTNYYDYYMLKKEFNLYTYLNSFIDSITLFAYADNTVITNEGIYKKSPIDYSNGIMQYIRSLDEKEINRLKQKNEIIDYSAAKTSSDGVDEMLAFTSPVYNSKAYSCKSGIVFVSVNKKIIGELLSNNDGDISVFSIYNGNKCIFGNDSFDISRLDNSQNGIYEENGKLVVYYCKNFSRYYVKEFSTKVFYHDWLVNIDIVIVLLLLLCLIGIRLAFYLAKKNYKPIQQVIEAISSISGSGDKSTDLKSTVDMLIDSYQQIQTEMDTSLPQLQANMIEKILIGDFVDEKSLIQKISDYKIELSANYYTVAVIKIFLSNGLSIDERTQYILVSKQRLEAVIKKHYKGRMLIQVTTTINVVIIFESQSITEAEALKDVANDVFEDVSKNEVFKIKIGLGNKYEKLYEIYQSYIEAKNSVDILSKRYEPSVIIYNSNTQIKVYTYPLELEQKLLRVTCCGNEEAIRDTLNYIIKLNSELGLSRQMYLALLNEINGTFMKAVLSINDGYELAGEYLTQKSEMLTRNIGDEQAYEMLSEMFLSVCKLVNHEKDKKIAEESDRVLSYIDDNYSNSLLNLALVADEINSTETYVSKIFVERFNKRFSQYLEDVRMEKAVDLLTQTGKSVEEVACEVGYSSAHAFRRAYKRKFNSLPSQLR